MREDLWSQFGLPRPDHCQNPGCLEIDQTIRGEAAPTLYSLLDTTQTAMGARLLRHWLHHPLRDTAVLRRRQSAIGALSHASSRLRHPRVAELLASWSDVERIATRVALRTARPRRIHREAALSS